jgi:hypothetical protein
MYLMCYTGAVVWMLAIPRLTFLCCSCSYSCSCLLFLFPQHAADRPSKEGDTHRGEEHNILPIANETPI